MAVVSRLQLAWPAAVTLLMLCGGIFPRTAVADSVADIDFNRDIGPLLSDRCFKCHGPDAESREADLRLDMQDAAADVVESGELLRRTQSDDPEQMMPPPDSNLSLDEREKQLLADWIAAGGKYDEHWAFQPLPGSVPFPPAEPTQSITESDWPQQRLDHFVLSRLHKEGLRPAAAAPAWRWLRRVTFDLTGLPPTPAELESFQQDLAKDGEAAYALAVDRLLRSPAFGERMAVDWLDAARYADSYGYQSDKLNTQWPYRDWVVRAFNENLPYDQFLTWQLAGDLLEDPTSDQRLATAFNRIHRLNNEGGAVFEEWRIENVADRVHTFGTAILGLTLECCRCHDHKYDPISTREYYSLSAFFNSIDENGLYDRTEKVPSPTMLLPTSDQQKTLEDAQKVAATARREYQDAVATSTDRWHDWQSQQADGELVIPDQRLALGFDTDRSPSLPAQQETGSPTAPQPSSESLGDATASEESEADRYFFSTDDRAKTTALDRVKVVDCEIPPLHKATVSRQALVCDGERGVTVKDIPPFDRWTPFTVVMTIRDTKRVSHPAVLAHHSGGTDAGYNGWDLMLENGYVSSRMYRVWPGNAIGVRTVGQIPEDQWQQLTATYDGSSSAAGLQLFLNGQPMETTVVRDQIVKSANVLVDHGGQLVFGQRFRDRGFAGGLIDDVRVYDRVLAGTELNRLATGSPIEPDAAYFVSAVDKVCRAAATRLQAAEKAVVMAEDVMNEIPIMEEMDEERPTHVLARGQYDAPKSDKTLVVRGTLDRIGPPFPAKAPRDRLGLAQWVTDPHHPLTARVAVNRLWANFFADGLVGTPENFGLQGDLPTYPQLLDWLARDFVDSGWDVKRFCKNVALSATYRQDSVTTAEMVARDPENKLLARGPRYRLAAEEIRDLALASSGLLSRQQGGPPVSPYQPGEDLWKESNSMSPAYQQSVGEALYRRSLYSVWKRTAPLPNMTAFDSTSREACTVRRSRTNTPLQALVLLNDVQFLEAARVAAEQVLASDISAEQQLVKAFLMFTGREPDAQETEILNSLWEDEISFYRDDLAAANRLIGHGDHPLTFVDSPPQLAAMTVVCQAILNLDATVWSR